jgi:hypothetical protein
MNYIEEYDRRWSKYERQEFQTVFAWFKTIRKLLKSRIHNVKAQKKKPDVVNGACST